MENRNLDKALDIVSKLISGEQISERGSNAFYYQEYNNNAEVFDIVNMTLKKMNLNLYEYNSGLFISAGENNTVFGYSNEELRRELGIKVNRELYLAYFIIYNIITEFYSDSASSTYAEFVRVENVIDTVDKVTATIIDKRTGIIVDEIEENSFKQLALSWEELPVATAEDQTGLRAARNSKSGFVKIVFNFLVNQDLFIKQDERFYPTDRFRAMIENYFEDSRSRIHELINGLQTETDTAASEIDGDIYPEKEADEVKEEEYAAD